MERRTITDKKRARRAKKDYMGMKAYLDLSELKQLEEAATCLRDRLLIRLLARLGCRISEALGITVSDIGFNEATVSIEHLKTRLKLSCPQCSTRLSRTAKFCPGCGGRVEKAVEKKNWVAAGDIFTRC